MTEPTKAQIEMARRIAAETCEDPAWRPEIIAGKHDQWPCVRSALAAIIETTELVASYAERIDPVDGPQFASAFRAGHHYGKGGQ